MKKFIALLISLSLIALCACSGKQTVEEIAISVTESTTHPNSFTDWGTDLLPESFPQPISGMHDLKVENGKASDDTYLSDWVRLTFTCFEKDIYEFSNRLTENGYVGGIKNIAKPATYYPEGFFGAWQDNKNMVRISNFVINDTGEVTFSFDVFECIETFPEGLESEFPKFSGYSMNKPIYRLYNSKTEVISKEFSGALGEGSWLFDFGYENAFVGVTMEQLTEYENALVEALFAGNCSTSVVDGCTVISYDLIKVVDDVTYGVFMVYNQTLKTLDVAYTNNITLVTG